MNRLIMTKQGRYYDETLYSLEHKMAENIQWLIELADRLDIDIQKEMETFSSKELLGIKNAARKDYVSCIWLN